MHGRSTACWGLVAALGLALGACQPPTRERPLPERVPPDRSAAEAGGAWSTTTDGPADQRADAHTEPDDVTAGLPDDVTAESAAPDDAGGAGGWPMELIPGSHCLEPPERREARENMRRMAEDHERLAAALGALRAELQTQALGVANTLALERVPEIAADLAARCAEVPGAAPVEAGYLETLLREAAFWGAVCRTLEEGSADCDRLDAGGDGDGACCASVARLVWLARARPDRLSLPSAVGRAFGWTWARQNDERIWQVVRHGKGEASCTGLTGRDPPERWSEPACRALAARDVSRCAALSDPSHRRTCAALVHAILGPGTAAGDEPSAAGTLLREHVAPTGPGSPCADALPRLVTELLDAADVFELAPLVLPGIESDRGLAPRP